MLYLPLSLLQGCYYGPGARVKLENVCRYLQGYLQILDQGFVLHPGAYMRDFWNVMDITVVSCALTSFYHTVA